MNYDKACNILSLKEKWSLKELKKTYYKLALKYHPDKNKEKGSEIKFKEINLAYHFLLEHLNEKPDTENSDYLSIIKGCIRQLFPFLQWNDIFLDSTIHGILNNCKKATLKIFNEINKDKALEVFAFLSTHRETFNLSQELLEEMHQIIQKKINKDHVYVLNPTINDLLNDEVYKLKIGSKYFMVPLWNHEVCFDISGADLIVYSLPELSENIYIDNNNNIIVKVEEEIKNLLKEGKLKVSLGEKTFEIPSNKLVIMKHQYTILEKQGILKIDEEDLYSTLERSDVIIELTLY